MRETAHEKNNCFYKQTFPTSQWQTNLHKQNKHNNTQRRCWIAQQTFVIQREPLWPRHPFVPEVLAEREREEKQMHNNGMPKTRKTQSLLHFPPAPSSGKCIHHSKAKREPVSFRPKKWMIGIHGTVSMYLVNAKRVLSRTPGTRRITNTNCQTKLKTCSRGPSPTKCSVRCMFGSLCCSNLALKRKLFALYKPPNTIRKKNMIEYQIHSKGAQISLTDGSQIR